MVAIEGRPNDPPKCFRDRDRGATNWPPLKIMCTGAEIHWVSMFLCLFGEGRRVDETTPMSGGIKLSGFVLVKVVGQKINIILCRMISPQRTKPVVDGAVG